MTNKIQTLTARQVRALADDWLGQVAGYLHGTTGVQYSVAELRETLAITLTERGAAQAIVIWDERRGLDTAPTLLLGAWAAVLNELAEQPAVAPAVLGRALVQAIRLVCGPVGGSVLVWLLAGSVAIHVLRYLK